MTDAPADLRTFGYSLVARRSAADLADLMKSRVAAAGGKIESGTDLSRKGGPFGALAGIVDLPPEAVPELRRAFDEQDDVDCFIGSTGAFQPSFVLVSDMDSTIIGQECIDELADALGLRSVISEITERAMRGELDFEAALTERVAGAVTAIAGITAKPEHLARRGHRGGGEHRALVGVEVVEQRRAADHR